VPNALQGLFVKHVSGKSSYLAFKSYEMEAIGFMGESIDVIWLDEEPAQQIYSQALTRIVDRGGLLYMTFTPENGVTQVVGAYLNNLQAGQDIIRATWDDASEEVGGHLTKEAMEQILSAYHPSERDLRTKGIPVLGSGLVYPIPEGQIICEPFPIPDYYRVIGGIDFGWDHPTAAVWIAHNADSDCMYVYDCYRENKQDVIYHSRALKARGQWVPFSWPHDGNRKNGYGGPSLADSYRKEGVRMHFEKFTNPPAPGQTEGQGGNEIMPGIMEILGRMKTGRFKVFSNLKNWLEEYRTYHWQDGKPVPLFDDLMQATRYAVQMNRWGVTKRYALQASQKIEYPKKTGIV
jgi:phage terminase large subunit-like protein